MLFGKRVQRSWASVWRVEFREVVRRILGTGGGVSLKRVGNLRESDVGVRSRFVLVVEAAVEEARGRGLAVVVSSASDSSSDPESESNMLSASSS